MLSEDPGEAYYVPVKNRTWVKPTGFKKPNTKRSVGWAAPHAETPEKHQRRIDTIRERRRLEAKDHRNTVWSWIIRFRNKS